MKKLKIIKGWVPKYFDSSNITLAHLEYYLLPSKGKRTDWIDEVWPLKRVVITVEVTE